MGTATQATPKKREKTLLSYFRPVKTVYDQTASLAIRTAALASQVKRGGASAQAELASELLQASVLLDEAAEVLQNCRLIEREARSTLSHAPRAAEEERRD